MSIGGLLTLREWALNSTFRPSPFVLSEEGARTEERLWNEVVDLLVGVDPALSSVVAGLA